MEIEDDALINMQESESNIYDIKLMKSQLKPMHKLLLNQHWDEPNMFFMYFDNGQQFLKKGETPLTGVERRILLDSLFHLYLANIPDVSGLWGLLSLKVNGRNGIQLYGWYTNLRSDLLAKKAQVSQEFRSEIALVIKQQSQSSIGSNPTIKADSKSQSKTDHTEGFYTFFISSIHGLPSRSIGIQFIEQITSIIKVDYQAIRKNLAKRVLDLQTALQQDKRNFDQKKLRKDPTKDIKVLVDNRSVLKSRSQNSKMEVEESIEPVGRVTAVSVKKRKLARDFKSSRPVFEDGYDTEPDRITQAFEEKKATQASLKAASKDQMVPEEEGVTPQPPCSPLLGALTFSSDENMSAVSFWSLQDLGKRDETIGDIDAKYDFSFGENNERGNDDGTDVSKTQNFKRVKRIQENCQQQQEVRSPIKKANRVRIRNPREKKQKVREFTEYILKEMNPSLAIVQHTKKVFKVKEKFTQLKSENGKKQLRYQQKRILGAKKELNERGRVILTPQIVIRKGKQQAKQKQEIQSVQQLESKMEMESDNENNTTLVNANSPPPPQVKPKRLPKTKRKLFIDDDSENDEINEETEIIQHRQILHGNTLCEQSMEITQPRIQSYDHAKKAKKNIVSNAERNEKNFWDRRSNIKTQQQPILPKSMQLRNFQQRKLSNMFDLQLIEKILVIALQNEQRLVYYQIDDAGSKQEGAQELLKVDQYRLTQENLDNITVLIKSACFETTYNQGSSENGQSVLKILEEIEESRTGISSEILRITQPTKIEKESIVSFCKSANNLLRNSFFWESSSIYLRNFLYLFYKICMIFKQQKYLFENGVEPMEKFRLSFSEFIQRNYFLACYQFIGKVLFNVVFDLHQNQNNISYEFRDESHSDSMDVERNSIASFVSQSIHEQQEEKLQNILNRIIVLTEIERNTSSNNNSSSSNSCLAKKLIEKFESDGKVLDDFLGAKMEDVISQRLFNSPQSEAMCSANTESLEISLSLIFELFYARDVENSQEARRDFANKIRRIFQPSKRLASKLFLHARDRFLDIFANVMPNKLKETLIISIINSMKVIKATQSPNISPSSTSLQTLFDGRNAFSASLQYSPDLILKVQEKSKEILLNSDHEADSFLVLLSKMEGYSEDGQNSEEQQQQQQQQQQKGLSSAEGYKDDAFLVNLPASLLEKYIQGFSSSDAKTSAKELKRLYSKFQSYIHLKKNENKLIFLQEILLMKTFLVYLDFNETALLKNILKKLECLSENVKESSLPLIRSLIYHIYIPLCSRGAEIQNLTSLAVLKQQPYQYLMDHFDYLVMKALEFSKRSDSSLTSTSQMQQQKLPNNNNKIDQAAIPKSQIVSSIVSFSKKTNHSVNVAIQAIASIVSESPDFVAFLAQKLESSTILLTLLEFKSEIDLNIRSSTFNLFLKLFSYPLTVIYESKNSQEQAAYSSQQIRNSNAIQGEIIQDISHNQISFIDDDSSEDEDLELMKETSRQIELKKKQCDRVREIQSILSQYSQSKIKRLLVQYITSIFNKEANLSIKPQYQANIRGISSAFRTLAANLSCEIIAGDSDGFFGTVKEHFLEEKQFWKVNKVESNNIKHFLIYHKSGLMFSFFSQFLSLYSTTFLLHQQGCKKMMPIKLSRELVKSGLEKVLTLMVSVFHLHVFTSFDQTPVNLSEWTSYAEQFKKFADQVILAEEINAVEKEKIAQIVSLASLSDLKMGGNKFDLDELDFIKRILKSFSGQQAIQRINLKEVFLKNLIDKLNDYISEVLFHKKANNELKIKLFNRTCYILKKIKSKDVSVQESIRKVFKTITQEQKSQDSASVFSLRESLIVKKLCYFVNQSENVDILEDIKFSVIIKVVIQHDLESYFFEFANYLKKLDFKNFQNAYTEYLNHTLKQKSKVYGIFSTLQNEFLSFEGFLSKIFRAIVQKGSPFIGFKFLWLNQLICAIQELKFKYFEKDKEVQSDLDSATKCSRLYSNVLPFFSINNRMESAAANNRLNSSTKLAVPETMEMRRDNKERSQQTAMNELISLLVHLDQISFLSKYELKNNELTKSSNFASRELERQIKNVLEYGGILDLNLLARDSSLLTATTATTTTTMSTYHEIIISRIECLIWVLRIIKDYQYYPCLSSEFHIHINLLCWKYFIAATISISIVYDTTIMQKFENGPLERFSGVCNATGVIPVQLPNELTPAQLGQVFKSLRKHANDIDETFQDVINMEGCNISLFIQEVEQILTEKQTISQKLQHSISLELETFLNFIRTH